MSTRSTLWYSDDLHLYTDGFDRENVYLEVDVGSPYLENLIVKIPLVAWKEMRKHTIQPSERYLDLTDDELHEEAERAVDEHRAWLDERKDAGSFLRSAGLLLFGSPESTRDEMIGRFVHHYRPGLAEGQA